MSKSRYMRVENTFSKWLQSEKERRNQTIDDIVRETGLSRTSVTSHLSGRRRPSNYSIERYCHWADRDTLYTILLKMVDHEWAVCING